MPVVSLALRWRCGGVNRLPVELSCWRLRVAPLDKTAAPPPGHPASQRESAIDAPRMLRAVDQRSPPFPRKRYRSRVHLVVTFPVEPEAGNGRILLLSYWEKHLVWTRKGPNRCASTGCGNDLLTEYNRGRGAQLGRNCRSIVFATIASCHRTAAGSSDSLARWLAGAVRMFFDAALAPAKRRASQCCCNG